AAARAAGRGPARGRDAGVTLSPPQKRGPRNTARSIVLGLWVPACAGTTAPYGYKLARTARSGGSLGWGARRPIDRHGGRLYQLFAERPRRCAGTRRFPGRLRLRRLVGLRAGRRRSLSQQDQGRAGEGEIGDRDLDAKLGRIRLGDRGGGGSQAD